MLSLKEISIPSQERLVKKERKSRSKKENVLPVLIPKIVHLTYKSKELIPEKWSKTINAWESFGWKVHFHSDKENDQLVKNEYPQLWEIYKEYKIPIQRVDAVRLCYLHKWGGVYSDLDLLPQEDLYHYFQHSELVFMRSPNAPISLTNMLMASRPKHPFWIELLNGLKDPYMPWFTIFSRHFKVMYSTGPKLLDNIAYKTKHPYTLLPLSILPCSVCDSSLECNNGPLIMLEGQSWNGPDSYLVNIFLCRWKMWLTLIISFIIGYILYLKYKIRNQKLKIIDVLPDIML
jgi:mannosyltransferase OCH1-like enzyme